jgi:integrase
MPKRARELTALDVRRLVRPGLHAVGGVIGLYLQVRNVSARSWILKVVAGSKRRMYGLGSYPTVTLEVAREKARLYRLQLETGKDPAVERRKQQAALRAARAKVMTFNEAAQAVMAVKCQEFSNRKHAAQWKATLDTYASPVIGSLSVQDIETAHILKVLEPIWSTKTETATRVRQRIEKVFDWCQARGYRTGDNPARWDGHLKELLPQPSKIRAVQHFAALPYVDLPAFVARLQGQRGIAAKALCFAILTAARSGEVRGARWAEIDLNAQLWTVPADRMKMRREHRVPLSIAAATLLADLPRFTETDLVFPSTCNTMLSATALLQVCRRMGAEAVPHGFRATFRTWASEKSHYHQEVIEKALAHTPPNKVEVAYQRGDLLEKRRALMNEWAEYCLSAKGGA